MGVALADFISFVINTDPANATADRLSYAVAAARAEITEPNGLRLLIGNVASEDEVQQKILGPVLEALAQRLAVMDRTAAATQAQRARMVAEHVHAAADRLVDEARRRARRISYEDEALRTAATRAVLQLARAALPVS
jgi:hypothetical protein